MARAGAPVLADTFSPEVASAAIDAGAAAINDIGGGADRMLALIAEHGCGYVLMHIEGPPRVDREPRDYDDVVAHVGEWFAGRIERAAELGVDPEQIALDPGLDFDLSADDDLELLRRLGELRELGRPLFVALSRKDFLGAIAAGSWERRLDAAERRPGDAGGDRARGRRGGRDAPPARRRGARRDADRRGDHGGSRMTRAARRSAARLGAPGRRRRGGRAPGDDDHGRAARAAAGRAAGRVWRRR